MKGFLSGQTVVITGAGRGLGRAAAIAMAREGADLWICARTKSELEKTADQIRELGNHAETRELDLADDGSCSSFINEVLEANEQVDVLVNNAGLLYLKPVDGLSKYEWSQTIAVNLSAPFLLIKGFLPGMRERGGSIINVSSRAGIQGFSDESAYCASKFGLEGMTKALALELEGTRVSINTITPGLKIKPTSLTEQEFEDKPLAEKHHWQNPNELMPAFLFLAGLRGQVGGLRFDAYKLSETLAKTGSNLTPERLKELAE